MKLSIVQETMLMMGAMSHVVTMRSHAAEAHKVWLNSPLTLETDKCEFNPEHADTATLCKMLDVLYLEMHEEWVAETKRCENRVASRRYMELSQACSTFSYINSLKDLAKKIGVQVDIMYAESVSRFLKIDRKK